MQHLDFWIAVLEAGGRIQSTREVYKMCDTIVHLLLEEANVVGVSAPVTVCGDIHGQFFDILNLFHEAGRPPGTCFVFLGDFVDRGADGVEVVQLLLCYKLRYPKQITLLRGNHECRQITRAYGFYDECLVKYGSVSIWRRFCDVFDTFSLAAIIDRTLFCVHGGLSPWILTVPQAQSLDRVAETPNLGPSCDLLWSDPVDVDDGWVLSSRGMGYLFGAKAVAHFSIANNLKLIVRSHQLAAEGHQYHFNNSLLTIWSAPNYCGRCANAAAVLQVSPGHDPSVLVYTDRLGDSRSQ